MTLRVNPRTLVLAGVLFAGSLVGTVVTRSQPTTTTPPLAAASPVAQWLGLDSKESADLEKSDPSFAAELAELRSALSTARDALALSFDDPNSTDQQVRQCSERVSEAHDCLERRVVEHLILVRHRLTPAQQKRLFELCADGVRESKQYGWRHGGPPGRGTEDGNQPGRGRGWGGGQRGRGGPRGTGGFGSQGSTSRPSTNQP